MTTWLQSIDNGFTMAITYGLIAGLPLLAVAAILKKGKLNIRNIIFNSLFFVYICCVIALVFFPLPQPGTVAAGYKLQLIPFYAIYDTIKDFKTVSLFQIAFNVLMTVPFGAYFAFCKKLSAKKIVLLSLGLSLFIEIGQLTGLFFIYPGSYRCCDVDDLMLNTLGGYLGALLGFKLNCVETALKARKFTKLSTVELKPAA